MSIQLCYFSNGVKLMRAADKIKQKLSSSESRITNAKYKSKNWKVNLSALKDYLQYMSDDDLSIIE